MPHHIMSMDCWPQLGQSPSSLWEGKHTRVSGSFQPSHLPMAPEEGTFSETLKLQAPDCILTLVDSEPAPDRVQRECLSAGQVLGLCPSWVCGQPGVHLLRAWDIWIRDRASQP